MTHLYTLLFKEHHYDFEVLTYFLLEDYLSIFIYLSSIHYPISYHYIYYLSIYQTI